MIDAALRAASRTSGSGDPGGAADDVDSATPVFAGRKSSLIAIILLLLLCLITSAFYTVCWDIALSSNGSIEYEGHVLSACAGLSHGKNIYDAGALVQEPWSVVIYTPLYFVLGSGLLKAFGIAFWPLRMVSMFSCLLAFLGLFVLLKRCKVGDLNAAIGVCFFAAYFHIVYWSSLARVDMLGLALAAWGAERFVAGMERAHSGCNRVYALAPSLLLFLAAFFTKQQYFVFPIAVSLVCMFEGEVRAGWRYFLCWLAAAVSIVALVQCATNGFLSHLFYASKLSWEWETLGRSLGPFLQDPKTAGAVAALAACCAFPARGRSFEKLPVALLAVSGVVVLYSMGLRGAYHNHLLCVEFALSWLLAVSLQKAGPRISVVVLCCALLGVSSWSLYLSDLCTRFGWNATTGERLVQKDEFDTLKLRGMPVLSEDPSVALLSGATPAIVDATTFLNVGRGVPGGLRRFLDPVNRKKYSIIIINKDDAERHAQRIWPDKLVWAIQRNYRLVGAVMGNGDCQDVYVRR